MRKIFLLRYDTEGDEPRRMAGFLETVVRVHRAESITVTVFCNGPTTWGS